MLCYEFLTKPYKKRPRQNKKTGEGTLNIGFSYWTSGCSSR